MTSKNVIVIGGGLAGLASAVTLADAGFRVQLLEKRPHLGGRAASYFLPDGSHVDNCQHLTLGCCTNLPDFFRRVGAEGKIRLYDRLLLMDRAQRVSAIECSPLPEPFHLAPSLAMFSGLNYEDKRAIARAMLAILRGGGEPSGVRGLTMLEWLRRMGQTQPAIERFWRVVLISALAEELDRSDAQYGITVFWKAFLANRAGLLVGLPNVPLGELYAGCQSALEEHGGEIRARSTVRQLRITEGRVAGVRLNDTAVMTADYYVAAVPHQGLPEILGPEIVEREPVFAGLRQLSTTPITGVHLWFDRIVMHEPFLALLDLTVQWIFNKSRLYAHGAEPPFAIDAQQTSVLDREPGTQDVHRHSSGVAGAGLARPSAGERNASLADTPAVGQYLQLVISASYELIPLSRQEIITVCLGDLAEVLPATREARLLRATVVKETAATFSPSPGADRWRPAQRSPIPNLFLAGDWTQTGWPATMEGAVRSGYLAAEAILADEGHPQHFVRPDLPVKGLARFWSGE